MDGQTKLVGRHLELSQLNRIFDEDTASAVLVSGEPGIGKTALMTQVCDEAVTRGWRVVTILGVKAEQPFALGGLNQLVCALQDVFAELGERDRAALAPVLCGEVDSSSSAMQLMVALLNLLTEAARGQPVLLVVDDVHWLDDISTTVLGAIGRRLAHQRVRILAAKRVPSQSMFPSAGWTELCVDPMSAEDSAQLLAESAVRMSDADKVAILRLAAGNPLALIELPQCAEQVTGWTARLPLSERVVSVFDDRLSRIDAATRAKLLRAALDGTTTVARLRHRGRYLLSDVQEAVDAGLLIVNPTGQSVFRHPLVSAAVMHQCGEQEHQDAHRDLAALYDDVPVRRAVHLAAAATEPDQEVADLLARAAQLSVRHGGLRVAIEWFHRAAELSTDPHRRAALTADAVFFAARAGRFDKAQDISDAIGTGQEESAATVLINAYSAFHGRGEVITTHRPLISALERAEALDDPTVNQLVQLLLTITNFAGGYERWRDANEVLEPLSARVDPGILLFRHRYSDVATTAAAVRALLAERLPRLASLGPRDVSQLAFPAYSVDAMAELRAPLASSYEKFRAEGPSIDAMATGCAVMLDLMAAGHWEQAEQVGAECLDMARQIQGGELLKYHFLANLGVVAAWRGELDAARRLTTEVTEWSKPRGLGMYLDFARRITVLIALAEADFDAAYQAAVSMCPPDLFPPFTNQVGDGMLDLVEAAVQSGHIQEARAHVAVVARLRIAEVSPRVEALTLAISAMIAPDTQAGELYEAALSHPGLAGFPFEHARITLSHGMWLRRQRRHTQARNTLTLAAKAFDHLGAKPWTDRANAELRAAGAPGNRTVYPNTPLSAQEQRIAELAAGGVTTKKIAAQLTLSPRTVDTHLRKIFIKLGINSRAALSEALRQRDPA